MRSPRPQQGHLTPSGQSRASRYVRAVSALGIIANNSKVEMVDLDMGYPLFTKGNLAEICEGVKYIIPKPWALSARISEPLPAQGSEYMAPRRRNGTKGATALGGVS